MPPFWSIFNHYFFKVLSNLERRVSCSGAILKLRGGRRVTGCPVKHFSKAFLSLTVATLAERSEGQPKNKAACQVHSKSASSGLAESRNLAENMYSVTEKQSCRHGVYRHSVYVLCWSLVTLWWDYIPHPALECLDDFLIAAFDPDKQLKTELEQNFQRAVAPSTPRRADLSYREWKINRE